MGAKMFISQVEECKKNHMAGEKIMGIIAAHYKICQECREDFDNMEYEEETLIDLWRNRMFNGGIELSCIGFIIYRKHKRLHRLGKRIRI